MLFVQNNNSNSSPFQLLGVNWPPSNQVKREEKEVRVLFPVAVNENVKEGFLPLSKETSSHFLPKRFPLFPREKLILLEALRFSRNLGIC